MEFSLKIILCSEDIHSACVLHLYHAVLNAAYKSRLLLKADSADADGIAAMTFAAVHVKKLSLEALAEASSEATASHPRTTYALVRNVSNLLLLCCVISFF